MLKLEDFKAAKKRVDEVIDETRLIHSEAFSNECGNDVYIKPENLQKTGAFKIRGAYNKIIKLDDDAKMKGLIASSAGNHAQGVAYAARKLGVKATICMPAHTPLIKVEATKAVILVPIGGGGLIAGIACAAKQINPNVKIYGVEPEGAASALAAIHEDQVVTLAEANTIADGTAVKTIGSKTFEYIKKYVDGIITVNDYELMDAFLLLVEKHKLVAEGSGILSLAGLKKLYEKNKKVVSLVSGGNIDVLTISSMINKGLISRGRIFTFSVQLPDKPGQLELVSKVLNQCNANVIAVDHNQFKNFARFSEVELRVTVETNGNSHIQTIIDEFAKLGYNIIKIN